MFSRLALILALSLPALAQQPNWEQDLARRHQELIDRNGPGTDPALRDQLLALREKDQAARGQRGTPGLVGNDLLAVDRELTAKLKAIFEARGWPTIHLVGIEASNAATLILTHTADHAWQRTILPQLEDLADRGFIDASTLALVIDKELTSSGGLQRYGSQFTLANGALAMYAVEDPANLDKRRAQALLPPIEAYRQTLATMYHAKVSSQIVTATPDR